MINLLKIEWLKIKNYTGFILLASFFVVGIGACNYIVYLFIKNVLDKVEVSKLFLSGSPFDWNTVWTTVSYYSSYFLMLPALLIVILITNEFNYKTHRQNIIDGLSRFEFLKVKIAMALIFAIACTFVVIIVASIFGLASGSTFSLNGFQNVGYFLLKAFTYNMVAIVIALLTKRSGVAIAIFFIYTIFENGVSLFLFFLAVDLKRNKNIDWGNPGNYLPMNASDGLLTAPFEQFSGMARSFLPTDYNTIVLALALMYLVIFYFWSRRKMMRSDL
ncbi:MAG TPA: ABC transporter permease [Ferruginibacter sp.]|nr:ABC transporter permease [Ferruginibacter sp.]